MLPMFVVIPRPVDEHVFSRRNSVKIPINLGSIRQASQKGQKQYGTRMAIQTTELYPAKWQIPNSKNARLCFDYNHYALLRKR